MKIAGFLLLLSGWLLVLAAVMLLAVPASRLCFVLAGGGVDIVDAVEDGAGREEQLAPVAGKRGGHPIVTVTVWSTWVSTRV